MAWCPFAEKLELQPESDQQPAIQPTQFILHSIAAPWTPRRTYEFWQTTNLESHFGLGYDGSLAQFIGTQTRADANYRANLRPDGTGAVSIETASNNDATDAWTDAQVEQLIRLGVWLHQRHGIPLRVCRTWDDPGFGYHRLHAAWAVSGTDCPGDARVQQFKKIIFPGIVARATGQSQEDDMPTPKDLWEFQLDIPDGRKVSAADVLAWTDNRHNVTFKELGAIKAQLAELTAAVKALAPAKTAQES
ncbi:N-acetylmuramoyl-L-alanine amidase [Streptomyces sp. NPDC085929]|uniref:N-acetylmuramoyl-L-alanine amidase n=1 Tax=Streptomyces sp. NPDC085929 TaxID=3365739 RepID=UPI0037CF556D